MPSYEGILKKLRDFDFDALAAVEEIVAEGIDRLSELKYPRRVIGMNLRPRSGRRNPYPSDSVVTL